MIAILASLLRAARLAHAIAVAHPDVPADRAWPAAVAIVAESGTYDPELLAAIAYGESRFNWRADNSKGCHGSMQVCGRGRYSDERAAYAAGVRKLDDARAYCLRQKGAGDWTRSALDLCTLAGYASGPAGVRGRWYRGPRAVLRRAERLRALSLGQRPGPVAQRSAS